MSATKTLGLVAAALLLVGCGAADHDDTDVAFAKEMIPHHVQAVEMSDMALEESDDAQLLTLAEEIRAAQHPEVDTMTGWLEEWGEDVPHADGHTHDSESGSGSGSGSGDMAGMMTAEDMDALAQASGAAFDRLWLEQMIRHHEGAVEMAEQQQADGSYAPAIELAGEIADAQRTEVDQMQALLAR